MRVRAKPVEQSILPLPLISTLSPLKHHDPSTRILSALRLTLAGHGPHIDRLYLSLGIELHHDPLALLSDYLAELPLYRLVLDITLPDLPNEI